MRVALGVMRVALTGNDGRGDPMERERRKNVGFGGEWRRRRWRWRSEEVLAGRDGEVIGGEVVKAGG